MPNTFKYIISSTLLQLVFFNGFAQTDSAKNNQPNNSIRSGTSAIPSSIVDTNAKKYNSISDTILKKNKYAKLKKWKPVAFYIGIDPVKLLYNVSDLNKTRLEAIIEMPLENKNWASLQAGFASAKFNTKALSYSNSSFGLLLNVQKTLFPTINKYDKDNAFIGLSYGFAINPISNANYSISDIWGTTSGTINGKTITAHFIEINAGFRLHIKPKLIMGWRIAGKSIINGKVFTDIAPIYIANYGKGDKGTIFGYNFFTSYKLF